MESGETGKAIPTFPTPIMTHHQKALTFQQPNERELKNVARWIYCWNLWTELVRQQLEQIHSEYGLEFESNHYQDQQGNVDSDIKESLLTELQTHIITNPIQTLSKVKTIRRIKEIGIKIDVWEKIRHEGVIKLSYLQVRLCEWKTEDLQIEKEHYKMLESLKEKFLDKIITVCKNIDYYYKQMEDAIAIFKNHRCNVLFANPIVTKAIEKFNKRTSQPFVIPGVVNDAAVRPNEVDQDTDSNLATVMTMPVSLSLESAHCHLSSKRSRRSKGSSSTYVPDVPDFIESLFAGRQPPKSKFRRSISISGGKNPNPNFSGNQQDSDLNSSSLELELSASTTKQMIKHYVEIIEQGAEWYFAWSQFTEKVLQEIKSLSPALGPEVMAYMTKHIKQQITLLKGLSVEVRSMGNKTKQLRSYDRSDPDVEMGVIITCLSVLDDFVSLIESIKHEASYLIRYVEITLINLGVLDLNKEPTRIHPLRLYLMRNIISMKDCHLLTSIDYLYLEMGYLLEYTENRFHPEEKYLEKFGQITADLLKKYTVNRKEAIQEKEFVNLQNVDKLELAKELNPNSPTAGVDPSTIGLLHSNSTKLPMSRYQRAQDLRKWVEESKKTVRSPSTSDFSDADDGSSSKYTSENFYDAPSFLSDNFVSGSPTANTCGKAWLSHDSGTTTAADVEKLESSFHHSVHLKLDAVKKESSSFGGVNGNVWITKKKGTFPTFRALGNDIKRKLSLKKSV